MNNFVIEITQNFFIVIIEIISLFLSKYRMQENQKYAQEVHSEILINLRLVITESLKWSNKIFAKCFN